MSEKWHPQPELEMHQACPEGPECDTERLWPAIKYLLHAKMISPNRDKDDQELEQRVQVNALANGIIASSAAERMNPNTTARACMMVLEECCRQMEYWTFRSGKSLRVPPEKK